MTSTLPFEILDLRHYSASHLRPILEHENRLWNDRLHWDFKPSADLLLQYLDSHILPGYIAVENGQVVGYIFCVYEESKAVIGDVFAHPGPNHEATAVEIENRLSEFVIELLQNSPGVDRIEAQLILHPYGTHQSVFESKGFTTWPRLFMSLDVKADPATAGNETQLPSRLKMRPWQDSDFTPAGRLIADAYSGHLDSVINDQYRTIAGSLRFLHNIIRFPGCGTFDPAASFVITGPHSDQLAGLLLCSRIRPDVAHVTQICVANPYRSQGFASRMLEACVQNLTTRNIAELTLTVTEGNTGAVNLYRRSGFQQTHTFPAMTWQRHPPPF